MYYLDKFRLHKGLTISNKDEKNLSTVAIFGSFGRVNYLNFKKYANRKGSKDRNRRQEKQK
jgi:hypothetical protein